MIKRFQMGHSPGSHLIAHRLPCTRIYTIAKGHREQLIVERRVPIVMGTDRCTMTSGLWYRTRAWRKGNGVIKDGLV
jgi:hypothetical protein